MADTVRWAGLSGTNYQYYVFPMDRASLKNEGGNYVYAKLSALGGWKPLYIGQSNDLGRRLSDHGMERCARELGATHIHAHLNSAEKARLLEESDLIAKWQPPCNVQGKDLGR